MNLIILGAPGAGKGTHAEALSKRLNIPTISTGAIIRNAIRTETRLGLLVKNYIDKGELIPNDVVIEMVKERLKVNDTVNGFILDGFPRTVPQAQFLDQSDIVIDKVLTIEVSDQAIIERLSGRRVCPSCGATYHLEYKPPSESGICNNCKTTLTKRDDDQPETVKNRLMVYHRETEPLKEYYKVQNKLCVAHGQILIEETTKRVFEALEVD